MNLSFDTHIFILVCCLLQGLAGLRLIKVSIPAYKLRGESTFLECQYELNKSRGVISGTQTISRNNHNHHHYQRGVGISNMNYVDNNDSQGDDEIPAARRMRTQQQQQQKEQQQQPYRRQPYFQPLVQAYKEKWQGSSSSNGASGSNGISRSVGSASGSITTGSGTYYQQQYPYQQQQSYYTQQYEQSEYQQYTPPPSPYGHSIYRGRTQTASSSSQSSSSMYNNKYNSGGAHVGASTYTGKTYINSSGTIRGSSSFAHHPQPNEDSSADSHEREEHADDMDDRTNEGEDDEDDDDSVFGANHDEEEGEDLYAIKWYKDNEEFYRYVPKANPPKTSYRVDGVRVIEEHSDHSRVLLRGLTINSTGLYRCEISAEAPNFSSVQGEGRMDIVYLPRDGPHIKGQQFQYQIGETLSLNCTSGKSHPASHLQWFINDQPVVDDHYLIRYNDTVHRHGLITSTLGLEMTVDGRHFNNGAMRVKCLASISPVLWKGGKESVLQRRPGIIDNREAMLLVRSSSSSLHHYRRHNYHSYSTNYINNSLKQLCFITIITILMNLCQLIFLHTEYNQITT